MIFVDLATDAMTAIGQLGTGQSISPEEAEQALRVCNSLLGKWSVQRLMLPLVSQRTFNLSPGTQDYTIGPSGTVGGVAVRPTFVESAQAAPPGSSQSNTLSILDKSEWDAIGDKGAQTSALGIPQSMYPEFTSPNVALHFWPIPSNAGEVTVGVWEPLTKFATIYDDANLPEGYEEALRFNLALNLCPFFDMPPGLVSDLTVDAINSLKKINAQSIGGSLGDDQTLKSPNTGQPQG